MPIDPPVRYEPGCLDTGGYLVGVIDRLLYSVDG